MAITLVAPQVRGSFASAEFPYRSRGYWLHVYMTDELIEEILKDFENLLGTEAVSIFTFRLHVIPVSLVETPYCILQMALPKTLVWPPWHFALTIGC